MEFIRFNRDGKTDKRKFFVGGTNPAGLQESRFDGWRRGTRKRLTLSATLTILNEITSPALGIYSVYSLLD